jgi:hypothetical protein
MYIGHVINLVGIYFKELHRRIFGQLTTIDQMHKRIFKQFTTVDHTPFVKFDPLTSRMEVNTPTINPPHLL